jgi:amino acid transporter
LASNKQYLFWSSLGLLAVAVVLNLVGLNVGKWLQNAGGVGTYVPLLMLLGLALYLAPRYGSATHFSWKSALLAWPPDLDKLNFWSNIAFAFTGLELVCAMSEEVREPRKTFPRAIYASGALIAVIYILGTVAVLGLRPAANVDPRNGVFQAVTSGSSLVGIAWFGIIAALLVTAGNAGGVGATVAGVARIPFVAGIDHYLPSFFGKIHPRWKTPWISILIQAAISALILAFSQLGATVVEAYQFLVSMSVILYFVPFLYMYAAAIKLAYRPDRGASTQAVLVPGGKAGIWLAGSLAFLITAGSMIVAGISPEGPTSRLIFLLKVVGCTVAFIGAGLILYFRGAMKKSASGAAGQGQPN